MTLPSTSLPDDSTSRELEREHPVVLVIRHPEVSDEIELFGLPAETRIEYLDLGSAFDVTHPSSSSQLEASDWAEWYLQRAAELPDGHGAKARIRETVADVCEAFVLNMDGSPKD